MNVQDITAVSVAIYLCVLLLCGVYVYGHKKCGLFEPITFYFFFLTLFSLPLPIRYVFTDEVGGNVSPQISIFGPYLHFAVYQCAVSLVVFSAFYFSKMGALVLNFLPRFNGVTGKNSTAGIFGLVVICAGLLYLLTKEVGGFSTFILLGYGSSSESYGKGYLAVGFPWLVVAMLALFEKYSFEKNWGMLWIGVSLFVGLFILFMITGKRYLIMYMAIALIVLVHLRIRRISPATLGSLAIVGFMALNLVGVLRGSSYESLSDVGASYSEKAATKDHESLFYTLTEGEFVVPFETFPQMIRTVGISDWPWFGATYMRVPVFLIPSFLFPDRPLPTTSWYMKEFYGEGHKLNEGRAFFFLSEGYMNFGPAGIIFISAAWGVIWGALYRWMKREEGKFGVAVVYSLSVAFMFRCIAGDAVTLVVGLLQQSLAGVIIILLLSSVWRRLRF